MKGTIWYLSKLRAEGRCDTCDACGLEWSGNVTAVLTFSTLAIKTTAKTAYNILPPTFLLNQINIKQPNLQIVWNAMLIPHLLQNSIKQ